MNKVLTIVLSLILVLSLASCASATRMGAAGGSAMVGAALAGPPGAFVGGAVGSGAATILIQEDTIEDQQETIQALSRGDVEGIVESKKKSWGDKVIDEVMGIVKLITLVIVLLVVGVFLYTLKRKGAAKKYYDIIERWIEEEKNEQK
jgi:hypothetical protein